jgi:hypothetical protein
LPGLAIAGVERHAEPLHLKVLGEDRTFEAVSGRWQDRSTGYQVHLYRIDASP